MNTPTSSIKAHVALLSAIVIWSLSFIAIRYSLHGYSPGSLSLLRYLIASICLLPIFLRSPQILPLTNKQWLSVIFIGATGIAGYSLLLNKGEQFVPSGTASFIVSQTPVLSALLAIIFLRERIALMNVIGIVVSIAGVSLIAFSHMNFAVNKSISFILLATLFGSFQSILQKSLLTTMTETQVVSLGTFIGTSFLCFFARDLDEEIASAPSSATLAVVFLGVVPSILGQWLWCYGLARTTVIKASVYLYAMPLLSTVFAWIILSELPTVLALVGGLIALCGAVLVKADIFVQRNRLTSNASSLSS